MVGTLSSAPRFLCFYENSYPHFLTKEIHTQNKTTHTQFLLLQVPEKVLENVKSLWSETDSPKEQELKNPKYAAGFLIIKKPNQSNFIIFRSLTDDFDCQGL